MLVLRGLLAAAALALRLCCPQREPPVAGLAGVPSDFLNTMVSLWVAQGQAVQVGSVGPMMLRASVSVYALLTVGPSLRLELFWVD